MLAVQTVPLCIKFSFVHRVSYLIALSASIHPPRLSPPPPMWGTDVIAPPVAINSWKQTTLLTLLLKEQCAQRSIWSWGLHPASEVGVLWNSGKYQSCYSLTVCTILCCSFLGLVSAEYTVHAADTVCCVCVLASRCYMSSAAGCVLQRKAVSCLNCAVCATLEKWCHVSLTLTLWPCVCVRVCVCVCVCVCLHYVPD